MAKSPYNALESATHLGVSTDTIRALCHDFRLEKRYVGRRMLITTDSLNDFVASLPRLPDPEFWD